MRMRGGGSGSGDEAVACAGCARGCSCHGICVLYLYPCVSSWLCAGIVSEGTATPFANLDANGVLIPSITDLMNGVIGVQLFYDTAAPAYTAMVAAYKSGTSAYESLVDLQTVSTVDPNSIGPVPTCTYDSLTLLGMALHQLVEVQQLDPRNISNRAMLFDDITKIGFQGASGELLLDANGIRTTGFSMQNFQVHAAAGPSFVNLGPVTNSTFVTIDGTVIVWMGTQGRVPDEIVRTVRPLSSGATTALRAVAALLVACIVVVLVAIAALRNFAVFKAASPMFLGLMCAGTGLLCASVFPRTLESAGTQSLRDSACVADLYLSNLGYTLLVGSLLVKEYRIQKVRGQWRPTTQQEIAAYVLAVVMLSGLPFCAVSLSDLPDEDLLFQAVRAA